MTLEWNGRSIELWGRTREGFESFVFNGIYHIGKIEIDQEKPALLLILSTQNVQSFPVCYRASFLPIVHAEDTVRPRGTVLSDCFETAEEAKQWCQDLEDRYQARLSAARSTGNRASTG